MCRDGSRKICLALSMNRDETACRQIHVTKRLTQQIRLTDELTDDIDF